LGAQESKSSCWKKKEKNDSGGGSEVEKSALKGGYGSRKKTKGQRKTLILNEAPPYLQAFVKCF